MREPNKLCRQLTMNTFVCGTMQGSRASFVDNLQWTPLCAVQYKAAKPTKRIPTELSPTKTDMITEKTYV